MSAFLLHPLIIVILAKLASLEGEECARKIQGNYLKRKEKSRSSKGL